MSDWGDCDTDRPDDRRLEGGRGGTAEVRIRQDPGRHNSMGRMKFMFPNRESTCTTPDTLSKELLASVQRRLRAARGRARLASGCSAGSSLEGRRPEEKVPLDKPVPVYLTYMTAVPNGDSIRLLDDVYGRDARSLAVLEPARVAAR